MNIKIIADVLFFAISLGIVWFGYFWLYKRYTVDVFRQNMFALRDSLFDEAANGTIPFDHPAYEVLRGTMNGFLRFGHRISLFEMLMHHLFTRGQAKYLSNYSFKKRWDFVSKDLPVDTKNKLNAYRHRMNELLLIQSVASSPFFFLLILMWISIYILPQAIYLTIRQKIMNILFEYLSTPLNEIESTAMAYGSATA